MRWVFRMAAVVMLIVALAGCGSAEIAAERDAYREQVAELQAQVERLEAELEALKNAPQELLKRAVEARENGEFDEAARLLEELASKYPSSPEAGHVAAEQQRLDEAVAAKREADRQAYEEAVAAAKAAENPVDAKMVLQQYLQAHPASAYSADVKELISEYDEQIRIAEEEAKKPPVEIVAVQMSENSIGTPEIHLTLRNVSNKTMDGFEFSVDLYDNYDRPVNHYGSRYRDNAFNGISQHTVAPGQQVTWYWTLYGFDLATKPKNLRIRSVHFTDGSLWRP